jgi:hypothetical protein
MAVLSEELEEIGERIERLATDPDSISAPLTRLFRPFFHRIGWKPKTSMRAVEAMLEQLRWIREREGDAAGEGERARLEALYHDDLALKRRYERWFPAALAAAAAPGPSAATTALAVAGPEPGTLERDDLDSVQIVLATIAEVVESVGSQRLGRQADAVDLLERLLPNARLSPARYLEVVRSYPAALAPALAALHGAVEGVMAHGAPSGTDPRRAAVARR